MSNRSCTVCCATEGILSCTKKGCKKRVKGGLDFLRAAESVASERPEVKEGFLRGSGAQRSAPDTSAEQRQPGSKHQQQSRRMASSGFFVADDLDEVRQGARKRVRSGGADSGRSMKKRRVVEEELPDDDDLDSSVSSEEEEEDEEDETAAERRLRIAKQYLDAARNAQEEELDDAELSRRLNDEAVSPLPLQFPASTAPAPPIAACLALVPIWFLAPPMPWS